MGITAWGISSYMQEALEAYKSQNQFLSSEIVELNAMRSDENEAIRANNR